MDANRVTIRARKKQIYRFSETNNAYAIFLQIWKRFEDVHIFSLLIDIYLVLDTGAELIVWHQIAMYRALLFHNAYILGIYTHRIGRDEWSICSFYIILYIVILLPVPV